MEEGGGKISGKIIGIDSIQRHSGEYRWKTERDGRGYQPGKERKEGEGIRLRRKGEGKESDRESKEASMENKKKTRQMIRRERAATERSAPKAFPTSFP